MSQDIRIQLMVAEHRAEQQVPNHERALSAISTGRDSAGLGALALEPVVGDGVSAALIDAGPVDVRWRRGGERIRPGPGRRNRRLKSLFREAGVLPWMRDRVPLIYAAGDLVAVGDLWVDGDRIAGPAGLENTFYSY